MIDVIIVDDHEFFRKGVKYAFLNSKTINIIAEAEDGKDLMKKIQTNNPAIILLDVKMPVMDGIETLIWIKQNYPNIKVIMLSAYQEEEHLERTLKNGADGFVLKNARLTILDKAIHDVFNNKQYFSEEFIPFFTRKYIGNSVGNQIVLTDREIEILQLIANGSTDKDIAEQLCISVKTARNHRNNIISKTGVKNTASLMVFAIKNGLVKV